MEEKEILCLKRAGQIASEARRYAKEFIKKDMPLIEIAEKIESKIIELGGKPAFPVNLSINEIAAHVTPSHIETKKAEGLLKVDLGAHIEGYIADTACSIDLENKEENKKLILAAEKALEEAINLIKNNPNIKIREIGRKISETIISKNAQPIQNLSGHSISEYTIHAGITIPNYDNAQEKTLHEGVYAVEPFTTSGRGAVKDGKPSGIYALVMEKNVRDSFAREILHYIQEEYRTLPFCSRWLVKKFGSRALIALKRLEEAEIIHQYPQLIEISQNKVAQAEHTIILTEKKEVIVTTE